MNAVLHADFAADVRAGLSASPKSLPPRWFYDELGSLLFDAITLLPEYYLTRSEQAILDASAGDIVARLPGEVAVVELGSGSSAKTRTVLRALLARQPNLTYCPIDISEEALQGAAARLRDEFPGALEVKPVVGRYRPGLAMLRKDPRRKLVLFLGSSIGNFDPAEAARLLRDARGAMDPEDRLLLGTDMVKDPALLHAAYNDGLGLTAAFNRNLLARVNRELGADFDVASFRHLAEWNPREERVQIFLVSSRAQRVRVPAVDLEVAFAAGEALHTENSYKFTPASIAALAEAAGLAPVASWHDPRRWFGLHLLRPA